MLRSRPGMVTSIRGAGDQSRRTERRRTKIKIGDKDNMRTEVRHMRTEERENDKDEDHN